MNDDQIRIEIDHRQWHAWRDAAVRARITQEGMSGLLELRISVKARARGATLTEQPRLWLRHDPIALVVHARGEGLTPELVHEAVAELTAEAEIAAEAEAAFMASGWQGARRAAGLLTRSPKLAFGPSAARSDGVGAEGSGT